ncbi:hypothetical protein Esti_003265 [Eimeria stiedai]
MAELVAEKLDITDHENLRDRMMYSGVPRYHPITYLRQLLTLRQGKLSAYDLGTFVRKLLIYYERSVVRWSYPSFSLSIWGTCYLEGLNRGLSQSIQPQCSMLGPNLPTYLNQLIRLASAANKASKKDWAKPASPTRPPCCPVLQKHSREEERSMDSAAATPTRGNPRRPTCPSGVLPCCFCGEHGHRHQTCETYRTFRNNRGSSSTNPVSAVGLEQDGENQVIRLGSPLTESPITLADRLKEQGITGKPQPTVKWTFRRPIFTLEENRLYHKLGQARKQEKSWTRDYELQFRALAEKKAMHLGEKPPMWAESSERVSDDFDSPRCAPVASHGKAGGSIFPKVSVDGETAPTLCDTGSARTLLDANVFTPNRLRGFRACTRRERDALIDAPGNRIPVVGVWEAWVSCAELAGRTLVDVVQGLPAKVVPSVDSFRTLELCVVYSGSSLELKAGGWRMRDLGFLRLSSLEDRPSAIGGVGLLPDPSDPKHQHFDSLRSLSVVSHYASQPHLYSVADNDDLMRELEALRPLGLSQGDYARIARSLIDMTHANEKFEWIDSKQDAINTIKRAILEVAKLAHPQPGKPFIIDCDACEDGLEAVLAQADEQGREHPIAFASRLLRPNESRWPTMELEAYAVVWALDAFLPAGKCHNVPDALSRNAMNEPGDADALVCNARTWERTGVRAAATQTTPPEDMSREQHVSRAGGGAREAQRRIADVAEWRDRQSPAEISMKNIRAA